MPYVNENCVPGRRNHNVEIVHMNEKTQIYTVRERDGHEYEEPFDHVTLTPRES